ncbi:579e8233-abc6-4ddb-9827-eb808c2fb564 [Thermothielavioides terrestris]|uniref:579e8233-abc6-4ddb-9827-eb808c2fb564 n=1 Tax=Thermothielavioides terrestris TaxID=2587410 RepID=A0A3S4C0U7_9PEZI|nr:579e8233-abc6-4ddb-9827-eb808c2fb564 [Thermothielavioides terrestris]
MTVVYKYRSL